MNDTYRIGDIVTSSSPDSRRALGHIIGIGYADSMARFYPGEHFQVKWVRNGDGADLDGLTLWMAPNEIAPLPKSV